MTLPCDFTSSYLLITAPDLTLYQNLYLSRFSSNVDTHALVEFCEEDKPLGVVPVCNIKKPAEVLHIGDKCSVRWSNQKSYDGLLIYSGNLNFKLLHRFSICI